MAAAIYQLVWKKFNVLITDKVSLVATLSDPLVNMS